MNLENLNFFELNVQGAGQIEGGMIFETVVL